MSQVYEDIEQWRQANPNAPEPDSHEEDIQAFGECRKCAINEPDYGYTDCPFYCDDCHAYDEATNKCACEDK